MTRIGTVISIADPLLAEAIGERMDLAWIDLQHSVLSARDAQLLILALRVDGCAAHVRVPSATSDLVPALLDSGADGIVAPGVTDADAAAALVSRLRDRVECVIHVGCPAGVAAADAIAAVAGVDALVLDAAELAPMLGTIALREAVEHVAAAARRNGIAFGLAGALAPLDGAPDILVGPVDVRLYAEAIDRAAARLREAGGAAA